METVKTYDIVDIIFQQYRGEIKLPKDEIIRFIDKLLDDTRSIYNCVAYENCIRFNIPVDFMVLSMDTFNDMDNLLTYEILHAMEIGLLTEEFAKDFIYRIYNKQDTLEVISRDICETIGFKFRDKKRTKNPFFVIHEGVYDLSPFPILDSVCSLSKSWTSKKYMPSDLLAGKVSIICKHTMVAITDKLRQTSSPTVIIQTLLKYSSMYEDYRISNILQQVNLKRLSNSPRVLAVAKDILDTISHTLFSDGDLCEQYLGKLINLVHSI